jgi:two-component system, cell cycle sensor histidine kinase and response regulator CckA
MPYMPDKPRILIVEDERIVAMDLERALTELGFAVVGMVSNGKDAIAQVHDSPPNLVLMDIMLEGDMDGIEAARQIRGQLDIPVVYLSAHADERLTEKAKATEPYAYLVKPYAPQELRASIEMALHKHEIEMQLRRSEERFRLLFDKAPLPYQSLDAQGRLLDVNCAWLEALGYERKEVIGKWFGDFLSPGCQALFKERFPEFKARGETHDIQFEMKRKDGTPLLVAFDGAISSTSAGSFRRTHCIFQDITERKKVEDIRIQNERLLAVGELAGGVAHNFNNLLQVILAGVQTAVLSLESGKTTDAVADLTQVLETARTGAETVKRLQSFARVRSLDSSRKTGLCDLSDIAKEAIQMATIWWDSMSTLHRTKIDVITLLGRGCTTWGRDDELFEALLHLLKNAAEALQEGGTIEVNTYVQNALVKCTIRDYGVGIAPEHLGKILEPFFTTKGYQRAGMGLSSSYGVIKRHGGTITVESQPGQGACFTVTLPRAIELAVSADSPEALAARQAMTVLVIDDLPAVAHILQKGLSGYGQKVLTARSGSDGLHIYRNTPVDAVICDMGMPGMNGWEVGRQIKTMCEERGMAKTPFILLTGWGDQEEESQRVDECGVDRVIEKPLDITKILAVVRDVVTKAKSQESAGAHNAS